jgi:serine/threonine protein kinase
MPGPGESRDEVVDIVEYVHRRVIELMASTAAEMQLHPGDPPMEPKSDLSQARALAGLVATSEPSVEAFVKFGLEEAKSIVEKYRSLLLAMTRTLIAHPDRTLNARDAFYEMLTGQLPFTATDPMEWVHCHVARQPVPPNDRGAGVPGPLSAIVMKLLAKTGEERYQTAAGVEADQRRCLTEWEATGFIERFQLGAHDASDRLLIQDVRN